jgi:hypothetical protein
VVYTNILLRLLRSIIWRRARECAAPFRSAHGVRTGAGDWADIGGAGGGVIGCDRDVRGSLACVLGCGVRANVSANRVSGLPTRPRSAGAGRQDDHGITNSMIVYDSLGLSMLNA